MAYVGEQKREYQRQWLAKRRQDWIDSQGGKCAICGRDDLPFEVDHIDRTTKVDHKVWSWSKERREAELAKCQLLCQECHWSKTGQENSGPEHGTHGRYVRGCHCEECTTAHRERARATRAAGKKW